MKAMEEELVKMSGKGQLVVPKKIRKREGFSDADRFVAVEIRGGVLFKKVKILPVKIEFEALSGEIKSHLKKQRVRSDDVARGVKWAREQ